MIGRDKDFPMWKSEFLPSQISDTAGSVKQSLGGEFTQRADDFGLDYLDLSFQIGQAAGNFFWFWISVSRRATFKDVGDIKLILRYFQIPQTFP